MDRSLAYTQLLNSVVVVRGVTPNLISAQNRKEPFNLAFKGQLTTADLWLLTVSAGHSIGPMTIKIFDFDLTGECVQGHFSYTRGQRTELTRCRMKFISRNRHAALPSLFILNLSDIADINLNFSSLFS